MKTKRGEAASCQNDNLKKPSTIHRINKEKKELLYQNRGDEDRKASCQNDNLNKKSLPQSRDKLTVININSVGSITLN